jgi:hypothetical protein
MLMTGEFTTFVTRRKRQKGTGGVEIAAAPALCRIALGEIGFNAGKAMALGALIGAYQEDERWGLRALFPLACRTLGE